jgi:hypothetical protein
MTRLSSKRRVFAMAVFLATLVAAVPPAAVLAQAPAGPAVQAPPAARAEARDDDSGKWGLLGLLRLVGLAGLRRRNTGRSVTVADRPDRR